MIESIRQWYNESFTEEKYRQYTDLVTKMAGEEPHFRLAETPVFIPEDFKTKLLKACDDLIDTIIRPDFKDLTRYSIPDHLFFPQESPHCPILIFDFGVCINDAGVIEPQLIEMQGFPSLFCFQIGQANACREVMNIPSLLDNYLGISEEEYIALLKRVLIADADPSEVILLDYKPEDQKTRIDFAFTEKYLGIKSVCITKLIKRDKELFYLVDGKEQKIKRIYNRLIFEEFLSLGVEAPELRTELDIEWVPHPNWFCRISKYTLPFIHSDFVPDTQFVSKLANIPIDLENYVLKPLYSYAGMGVKIDVTMEDITSIADPDNWILQKKVHYAPIIPTPDIPAKCEIRMMAIWESWDQRPRVVHNLARLSKGKMIGVRYNSEHHWVGSSVCFFE